MSDLPKLLRHKAELSSNDPETVETMAADRIEALERENADLIHDIERAVSNGTELATENARLREALERHGKHSTECQGGIPGVCVCGFSAALEDTDEPG